jgi:C4-dicarboxylate-specific signal transduction histidine kinase
LRPIGISHTKTSVVEPATLLPSEPARWRIGVLAFLGLLAASLVAMHAGHVWSERLGLRAISHVAAHQLDLYAAGLERDLARLEYLPSYLELDPQVLALLRAPADSDRQRTVSDSLGKMSVRAGAISIFVLDRQGQVAAASNWQLESLVGTDYSQRPLFEQALRGGLVSYFSAASGRPEFYLAEAIRERGQVRGVGVVKAGLEGLEASWAASASQFHSSKFVVIDDNDVVVLSSEPAWKFRSLAPLSPERRGELQMTGQYPEGAGALEPLPLDLTGPLDGSLVQLPGGPDGEQPFVLHQKAMERVPWRLVALSDASAVQRNARNAAIAAGLGSWLLGLLALFLLQRQELGRRIERHNAQLRQANTELVREVRERERAEAVLREAQDSLVQAGKLALLGQMSAGVSHEISQPLTALRALAENAKRLLDMGLHDDVRQNLLAIEDLTARLGRLTSQLKSFARKAPASVMRVQLSHAVANALMLLGARIQAEAVQVQVDVPDDLYAESDSLRLEQVLVNLGANALDAMRGASSRPTLGVRAWADGDNITVRVTDTGSGIPDHAMKHLFEPFFTTKHAGEGLGLGLVISSQIVREFGGELRACNLPEGAAFEFGLRRAMELNHA